LSLITRDIGRMDALFLGRKTTTSSPRTGQSHDRRDRGNSTTHPSSWPPVAAENRMNNSPLSKETFPRRWPASKQKHGRSPVMGSGPVQTLLRHDLVDRFQPMGLPVLLVTGRDFRMKGQCPGSTPTSFGRSPKARFTWVRAPGKPKYALSVEADGPLRRRRLRPSRETPTRLFQAQRFPLPVPPSGPHSRLTPSSRFEVVGDDVSCAAVFNVAARRVQRSRCPVRRPQRVAKAPSRNPAGRLTYALI